MAGKRRGAIGNGAAAQRRLVLINRGRSARTPSSNGNEDVVDADLAVAVVVGVIVSALVFAWEHAKHVRVEQQEDENGSTIYLVDGPLFFGSIANFSDLFDPKGDPDKVVVDFLDSRVWDHSGLEAIDALADRYTNAGKRLSIRHLSHDCHELLMKAGNTVEVMPAEDPEYGIAMDYEGKLEH